MTPYPLVVVVMAITYTYKKKKYPRPYVMSLMVLISSFAVHSLLFVHPVSPFLLGRLLHLITFISLPLACLFFFFMM